MAHMNLKPKKHSRSHSESERSGRESCHKYEGFGYLGVLAYLRMIQVIQLTCAIV